MATLAKRVSDLEAWKTAHISGHVLSGHTHPGDATDADVAALDRRIDELEAEPVVEPVPPPAGTSVRVTSIPALLTALANNTLDEIVVANGTYRVSAASSKQSNSLWIGAKFAARTRPIVVRAETTGGVTFDGGGTTYFGGISFEEGAHHQTWQGFKFANGIPTSTGVIVFGGYPGLVGAHHITLNDITIMNTCVASTPLGVTRDHAVYFSGAEGGAHDILIDGLTNVAAAGALGLDSTINFGKAPSGTYTNARNVIVRNMKVTGGEFGVVFWEGQGGDLTVEDSTITNALRFGVRFEETGTLILRRVTTGNSGVRGFYSSLGATPAGVTFDGCAQVGGELVLT